MKSNIHNEIFVKDPVFAPLEQALHCSLTDLLDISIGKKKKDINSLFLFHYSCCILILDIS